MRLAIDGRTLAEAPLAGVSVTKTGELVISAPTLNLVLSKEETEQVRVVVTQGYREDA